jgi:hypothetical protein
MTENFLAPFVRVPRPRLKEAILASSKGVFSFLRNPILALVLAVLAWFIRSPEVELLIQLLLLLVVLSVLYILFSFVLSWVKYFRGLELANTQLRNAFFYQSGIGIDGIDDILQSQIRGIEEKDGTVVLVAGVKQKQSISIGAKLDVVTSTGMVWGTLQAIEINRGSVKLLPIDRANVDFWEDLEDRMKTDPKPPSGIHLEPHIHPEIRRALGIKFQEEE